MFLKRNQTAHFRLTKEIYQFRPPEILLGERQPDACVIGRALCPQSRPRSVLCVPQGPHVPLAAR